MLIDWIAIISAITWQNVTNFLINIGITGAVFLAALQFVAKKTIDYRVSQRIQEHKAQMDKEVEAFRSELQRDIKVHEQQLQVMTEETKFNLTRMSQDFSLYTNKRHTAYMELHELMIGNYSAVTRILMNFGPDFWHMTNDEIKDWLVRHEFGQTDKDNVAVLLERSKSQAVSELGALWHRYNIHQANVSFAKLKNGFLTSKLYMSKAITEYLTEFISKSSQLMTYYSSDGRGDGWAQKQITLDEELNALIDKITLTMKAELKRGYYPED